MNEECLKCGRKAQRYCELYNEYICSRCCAISRKENDCPPECPVLEEKKEYEAERNKEWLTRAVSSLSPSDKRLLEQEKYARYILLFEIEYFQRGLEMQDDDFIKGLELGLEVIKLKDKGVIWEPSTANINARAVLKICEIGIDQIEQNKNSPNEEDLSLEEFRKALKIEKKLATFFRDNHSSGKSFTVMINWRIGERLEKETQEGAASSGEITSLNRSSNEKDLIL